MQVVINYQYEAKKYKREKYFRDYRLEPFRMTLESIELNANKTSHSSKSQQPVMYRLV